ncbi:S8 family serine peptidase [Kitasatospora sp. NPDC008050]|uniref:S8 family serine peptidase n=1 Tax=Kitasatospora sp. NPDC008050 TaxID=3364021 RepID=UPI0036EFB8B3
MIFLMRFSLTATSGIAIPKKGASAARSVSRVSAHAPSPDPVLKQAVLYAQKKDSVIVASAGNSGTTGNPAMYPASFPDVVSVAGTDEGGKFWKESESGPTITVAAPATEWCGRPRWCWGCAAPASQAARCSGECFAAGGHGESARDQRRQRSARFR